MVVASSVGGLIIRTSHNVKPKRVGEGRGSGGPGHMLKTEVQKGRISHFWLIFIFCRIELIFGRMTFDMKNIVL